MDKELIDTILMDIGLEPVDNDESTRLPQPDKGLLDRLLIEVGLESMHDEEPLPPLKVVQSSK